MVTTARGLTGGKHLRCETCLPGRKSAAGSAMQRCSPGPAGRYRVPDLDGGWPLTAKRCPRCSSCSRGGRSWSGLARGRLLLVVEACSASSTARWLATEARRSGAFLLGARPRQTMILLMPVLEPGCAGRDGQAGLAALTLIVTSGSVRSRAEAGPSISLSEVFRASTDAPLMIGLLSRHDVPGADRARDAGGVHGGSARIHRAVAGLTSRGARRWST
jgi:hypothetical protein